VRINLLSSSPTPPPPPHSWSCPNISTPDFPIEICQGDLNFKLTKMFRWCSGWNVDLNHFWPMYGAKNISYYLRRKKGKMSSSYKVTNEYHLMKYSCWTTRGHLTVSDCNTDSFQNRFFECHSTTITSQLSLEHYL
jgi:hypothetical protein